MLMRGSARATLGTLCNQVRWQLPPMTSRSPHPGEKLTDRPPSAGWSRKRRGEPTETMATTVSSQRRPILSPWGATLSLPSRYQARVMPAKPTP